MADVSRALQQARRLGAEILVTRQVVGIDLAAREITLDGDEGVRAATMILATGVSLGTPSGSNVLSPIML